MVKKHILDVDEELWKKVLKHKIDSDSKGVNNAVVDLIKKGLKYKNNSRG